MNPLESYLTELREIHDSGAATKETSGYPSASLLRTGSGSRWPAALASRTQLAAFRLLHTKRNHTCV